MDTAPLFVSPTDLLVDDPDVDQPAAIAPRRAPSWPVRPNNETLEQFDQTVERQRRRLRDAKTATDQLVARGDAMTGTQLAVLQDHDPDALLELLQDPQTARMIVLPEGASAEHPSRTKPVTLAELALEQHGDRAAVAIARSPYSRRLTASDGTNLGAKAEHQSALTREVVRQDGGRGQAPEQARSYHAADRLVEAREHAETKRTWGLGALTGASVRASVEGPPPPVQRTVESMAPVAAKLDAVGAAVDRARPDPVRSLVAAPTITQRAALTGLEPHRNAVDTALVAQWNGTEATRVGNHGMADAAALAATAAEQPIRPMPVAPPATAPRAARGVGA